MSSARRWCLLFVVCCCVLSAACCLLRVARCVMLAVVCGSLFVVCSVCFLLIYELLLHVGVHCLSLYAACCLV